jgi:fibronectin-binding autotransporter adhesin
MRKTVLLGSTALLAAVFAFPAWAACAPDPAPANSTVDCTGSDADSLTLANSGIRVNIESGASVSTLTVTNIVQPSELFPSTNSVIITANGAISGGLVVDGGTLAAGAAPYFGPSSNVMLTVGAAGSIAGPTAILLRAPLSTPNFSSSATMSITNSGTISSTSGAAIAGSADQQIGINTLTNNNGGTIGAIAVPVGTLSNAGLIDGGGLSAIRYTQGSIVNPISLTNAGTISSSGAAATIAIVAPFNSTPSINNSGTIRNTGSGDAISDSGQPFRTLNVVNRSGSAISASSGRALTSAGAISLTNEGTVQGGVTAISADGFLQIVNKGQIIGDVVSKQTATTYPFPASSLIDLRGGTITGSVRLGAGDDRLIVNYASGSTLLSSISGTIDAGSGVDTLQVNFATDATLSAALLPAVTFEKVEIGFSQGATLTLDQGYSTGGGLIRVVSENGSYGGAGKLINRADLALNGSLLSVDPGVSLEFRNEGTITATLAGVESHAVDLSYNGSFANSGTITANGGNGVSAPGGRQVLNTGTIVADQTALTSFNGLFNNSGTITSRQGVGVQLSGNVGLTATNSGTILGATAGADISGVTLTNSGTISATTGSGVSISPYGSLHNQTGGVVNGGVKASALYGWTFLSTIRNTGTINGDVDLGSGFGSFYGSNNNVVLLPGGIINGNLVLGSGNDTLVTRLINTGTGQFAGVTGTVSGGPNSTLRYIVDADATATLGASGGLFSSVGYDLWNGAKLTLTATGSSSNPLSLSGNGSVDLTANIASNASTSAALIDLTRATYQPLTSSGSTPANALNVISRGLLTTTHTTTYAAATPAVLMAAGSMFTNKGEIIANDLAPYPYPGSSNSLFAIQGAGKVVNDGNIAVGGGAGAIWLNSASYPNDASSAIVNNGTISQIDGTAASTGITGWIPVVNNGTIATGGSALFITGSMNGVALTNSGTITSFAADAVTGSARIVVNKTTGTIGAGSGFAAISLAPGSLLDNAGTINGSVLLNVVTGYSSGGGSTYVARGGTINGNLTFAGSFVQMGGNTGVLGAINATGSDDNFIRGYTSHTAVDLAAPGSLPTSFERFGFGAIGQDVTVTLNGPSTGFNGDLILFGDGTFVNRATIASGGGGYSVNQVLVNQVGGYSSSMSGANFINHGIIADNVTGIVRGFANSGSIGGGSINYAPVELTVGGEASFDFANSGTIQFGLPGNRPTFGGSAITVSSVQSRLLARLANSGTIAGRFSATLKSDEMRFDNSGSIAVFTPVLWGQNALDLQHSKPADSSAALLSFANSGTIAGNVSVSTPATTLQFSNSGIITGLSALSQIDPKLTGNYGVYSYPALATANIVNSGTMTGGHARAGLELVSSARAITIANSGLVSSSAFDAANPFALPTTGEAMSITSLSNASASLSITNSGTVINTAHGGSGIIALANLGVDSSVLAGGSAVPALANAAMVISNSGIVRANAGAILNIEPPCCTYPTPAPISTMQLVTGIGAFADATGTETITITNAVSGLIEANGPLRVGYDVNTYFTSNPPPHPLVTGVSAGFGSIAITALGDSVNITNAGTINGGSGGTVATGTVIGIDRLDGTGAALDMIRLLPDRYLAGAIQTFLSTDRLDNSGTINGAIDLGAGDDTIINSGTINGQIFLRAGNDSVTNAGRIVGTLDMGAGDDAFILRSGSSNSIVLGGAGTDTLALQLTGTAAAPDQLNLASHTGFERLRHESGVGVVNGLASFDRIDVLAGRLIGNTGSTMSGGTINVVASAVFGSAGTVNSNVINSGMLSPGASPGTMTVNGNVSFAAGSSALFELSPAVSDRLLVNGALNIASNVTLNIIGQSQLVPGSLLNLVSASSGVTGSFNNVVLSGAIAGQVRQQAGGIQLLALFPESANLGPAAGTTAAYINGLITTNQASSALLAAMPGLLTASGSSDIAGLAQIRPEAYASAGQIGLENGLALATTLRGGAASARNTAPGFFGFAQSIGNWRKLAGNAVDGTTRANISQYGMLGGLGYGSRAASLAAFIGNIAAHQNNAFLAARTRSSGIVLGVAGQYQFGPARIAASLIHDASGAHIKRALPGATLASSHATMTSWTADFNAAISFKVGKNWALEPQVGYTHVWSQRGSVQETGSAAFNLAVDARRTNASFLDASITIRGGRTEGQTLLPWLMAGLRHQTTGRASHANAALLGVVQRINAHGVVRTETVATFGAGLEARVSTMATLFTSLRGELDDGLNSHFNAGLRLSF